MDRYKISYGYEIEDWVKILNEYKLDSEQIKGLMEDVFVKKCQITYNSLQLAIKKGWNYRELGKYYKVNSSIYHFSDDLCYPLTALCRLKRYNIYIKNIKKYHELLFSPKQYEILCYNDIQEEFIMTLTEILFLNNKAIPFFGISDIDLKVDLDKIDRFLRKANIQKNINIFTNLTGDYISDIIKDVNGRKYEWRRYQHPDDIRKITYTIQDHDDHDEEWTIEDDPEFSYYISSRHGFNPYILDTYLYDPDIYRASEEELIEIIESNGYTPDEDLDRTDLQDIIDENGWDSKIQVFTENLKDHSVKEEYINSRGLLNNPDGWALNKNDEYYEWRINGVLHNENEYAIIHSVADDTKEKWIKGVQI